MQKKRLIKYCLKLEDSVETYPFKDKSYDEYAVIRHKSNNKWFALIFTLEGKVQINLKCDPVESAFLRDSYDFITPGWHMNKAHWITVDPDKAPKSMLETLIKKSYDLTS